MKSRTLTCITAMTLFAALATAAQDNPSQDHKSKHHQYKLIDMGTFGGPASYIEVNGTGNQILNNRGIFTGSADTSTPDPYSPNCYNPDCYVSHAFRWDAGVVTDLGTLPAGYSSATGGINERGWIVGQSQNGLIDPLISFPETRAVLWTSRGIINLGTLGGNESLAVYVNNGGQVVGLATNAIPDPYSFFGWGAQIRTFLWENGVMRDVGTLGGPDATPSAGCTNQRNGLIAGASYINFTPNPTTGVPTIDPFLWKNGEMLDLGTLGGTNGFAQCANNRAQVAGQSNLSGDLTFHPFVWDKGVLTDLGTLGGNNGAANWINDAGDVVGYADLPGSQEHDAFLWKHGVMTDLGNLGLTSFAGAINSEGQVVGHSKITDGTFRAILWENGGPMIDLNSLIPSNSSLLLTDAQDINERGEIAGNGVLANGDQHAYLLIPCDEKHPGECDDYSMIEVATPQLSAFKAELPGTLKQGNETPVSSLNQLRNRLVQRYYIPGQLSAQRD